MTLLQSILLGIIQGLTEFLPVSSSAHLVLTPYLLGWQLPAEEMFVFDVLVQVASLAAVIAYFWRDLLAILGAIWRGLARRKPLEEFEARLGWLILLATIPAGVIGFLLKDMVEMAFASPLAAAIFLLITSGLLIGAEKIGQRSREMVSLNWQDALWVGLAQAAAVFPGLSRSGATITGGMARNLKRPAAARFAFLIAIPIMLAAGVLAITDLIKIQDFERLLPVFLPGILASGVVSYLSIRWLLGFLTRRSLYGFAIYCAVFGLFVISLIMLR